MGFLSSIFKKTKKTKSSSSKQKKRRSTKTDPTEAAATASLLSIGSEHSETVLAQEDPIPSNASEELRVVREWIRAKDEHNIEKMQELTGEGCFFTFTDSETEMPASEFYGAVNETIQSFPDIHFFWKSMKVQGPSTNKSKAGMVVVVNDYYGIGKHTGKAYGFGPYPPVEPTGKTVRDENIEFTFTVSDGKIVDATIYAFGELVGPPGFYTKIGGVILF
ncbi:expressed unknown protein [Seminavis robusta]|uniref:Uncharacterized protein n=1 Tax=Seminavis robusta TaxID=568900 RepID=A0A9N8E8B2_9STRA|nr:expressed unknown protein [Seminavis robusta]|eukprot:Sro794_g203350.1 n/a (220) ;mRNA; f:11636-12295